LPLGPGIDDPLIARYDGADYLYLKNHQGSVTELITFNGAIAKSYRYDAFGNIKQESGPTVNHGFTTPLASATRAPASIITAPAGTRPKSAGSSPRIR